MILSKLTARQWAAGALIFIAAIVLINWYCGKPSATTSVKTFIPKPDTKALDSMRNENKRITAQRDSLQALSDASTRKLLESNRKAARFAIELSIAKKAKDTVLILQTCDSLQEVVVKQEAIIAEHIDYVNELKARNDSVEQSLLKEIVRLRYDLGLTSQSNEFLSGQLQLMGKKNTQLLRKLNKPIHVSAIGGLGASHNKLSGVRLGPIGGIGLSYTIF